MFFVVFFLIIYVKSKKKELRILIVSDTKEAEAMLFYFSYGSNMSMKRIKERVPSVQKIGVACLYEHKLLFHKKSKDGSGKCDAYYTGSQNDYVIGVLYKFDKQDKAKLDRKEGLGYGYKEKTVKVNTFEGKEYNTPMYYATNVDENLKPYAWYKEHVVRGAIENNFPEEYINKLKNIEAIPDIDMEREEKELAIYR